MPKPKPRATAPWTHSSAPQTPRSGSVVRSRAFAFMLSTITICSGRHESRSTSRAESTRGGDRAQMQSRRRQAPTCTQSLHTCPIRFQGPAQNEPLLNLAEGSSTPGWRTPAEMSKTARPTNVTSSVTSTPPATGWSRAIRNTLDHGEEERSGHQLGWPATRWPPSVEPGTLP